jgi:hypothetical protein
MSSVERALAEVGQLLGPLATAVSSPARLATFLRTFGIVVDDAHATQAHAGSGDLLQVLADLEDALAEVAEAAADHSPTLADMAPLLEVVPAVIASLADLAVTWSAIEDQLPDDFAGEVFDLALVTYLATYHETTHALAVLLGLLDYRPVSAVSGDPDARDCDYVQVRLRWDRLGGLFSDPAGLFTELYGWGTDDFSPGPLLLRLQVFAQSVGLRASIDDLDPALVTALWPVGAAPAAAQPAVRVPIWSEFAADDTVEFAAEAGLQLSAAGGTEVDPRPGLALMPFADGTVEAEIPLTPVFDLLLGGAVDLAGGPVALLRPTGFDIAAIGPALGPASRLSLGLRRKAAPGADAITLIDAEGLGLSVASLFAAVRLEAEDVGVAFGLAGGNLGVLASGDGFLAKVLPDGFQVPFALTVSWSARHGLRIEGGAGLILDLPLGLDLGPFGIESIHVELLLDAVSITLELSASATLELGPIHASVTRIGVRADLQFREGNLGPLQLGVAFRPPDGAGLAIDASVVTGGGYILNDTAHSRYAGILQLRIGDVVSVTAIGLITTRMPDGSQGFSLLVIITATFPPIQLGFGFSLAGLGGILGLNRTMNLQALRDGARTGLLDSILFPSDPVGRADKVISDVESVFPVARDRFVIGLQARIGWGTPQLITVDLGIIVEVPLPLRIALIGRISVVLPADDAAVVELHLDVIGTIDTGRGELSIDARLHDSRVAIFTLCGDMALRLGWGVEPAFLVSVGGFNPRFAPPSGFPALQRLTIALGTSDNPSIRLETYFAITSNTVQAGARLAAHAELDAGIFGLFSADAYLGFDALVTFRPFGFIVDLAGGIVICRNGAPLLGADFFLTLTGPQPMRACGYAEVHILVTIRIPVDITVGPAAVEANVAPVDPWQAVLDAFAATETWSAQPAHDDLGVSVRDVDPASLLAHPRGSLTARQKTVPLDLVIERYGGAPLAGGRSSFAVNYRIGDGPRVAADIVRDAWAPGDLFELQDDEKLSRPSFEFLVSGHTAIGSPAVGYGAARASSLPGSAAGAGAGYETLVIDLAEQMARPAEAYPLPVGVRSLLDARDTGREERGHSGPPNVVTVAEQRYGVVGTSDLLATANDSAPTWFESDVEGRQALLGLHTASGGAGLQVVGAHEVRGVRS